MIVNLLAWHQARWGCRAETARGRVIVLAAAATVN